MTQKIGGGSKKVGGLPLASRTVTVSGNSTSGGRRWR
jgi:hypothetical protein